jgi:hypothetical protein
MPSRRLVIINARPSASVSVAKKENARQDRTVAQATCWLCAIMPLNAPQTPKDGHETANRSPSPLDALRGFETLPRTIAQAKAFAILW